jgi:hypothetical protein
VVYSALNGLPFTERIGEEPAAQRAAPVFVHDPLLGPMTMCSPRHSFQKDRGDHNRVCVKNYRNNSNDMTLLQALGKGTAAKEFHVPALQRTAHRGPPE